MTILEWDNEELDVRGTRVALNAEMSEKTGELYNAINSPESTACVIDEDGVLRFKASCQLDGQYHDSTVLGRLTKEGILTGVHATRINIQNIAEVTPETLPANYFCADVYFSKVGVLRDLNIQVSGSIEGPRTVKNYVRNEGNAVHFQWCFDGVKFENTTITFERVEGKNRVIRLNIDKHMNLSGLHSNVTHLSQYTLSDFPEELEDLFEMGSECEVYDENTRQTKTIKVKTLNKAIAIANNDRRYSLRSHILPLSKNANVTELFHIEDLPELEEITISNNNVKLHLVKIGTESDRFYNWSRCPNWNNHGVLGYNRLSTSEMYQKTNDGWLVIWTKNQ